MCKNSEFHLLLHTGAAPRCKYLPVHMVGICQCASIYGRRGEKYPTKALPRGAESASRYAETPIGLSDCVGHLDGQLEFVQKRKVAIVFFFFFVFVVVFFPLLRQE